MKFARAKERIRFLRDPTLSSKSRNDRSRERLEPCRPRFLSTLVNEAHQMASKIWFVLH